MRHLKISECLQISKVLKRHVQTCEVSDITYTRRCFLDLTGLYVTLALRGLWPRSFIISPLAILLMHVHFFEVHCIFLGLAPGFFPESTFSAFSIDTWISRNAMAADS